MSCESWVINKGKTFQRVIRWETKPVVRKAIAGIDLSSGAPRLSVLSHGLTTGWRAYCYGIVGTTALNAEDPENIAPSDYFEVTVIDANTVEFNGVNAANFKAYVSGGFLAWNTPHDLDGYTCRVKIKDRVGGTVLLSTEVADAPKNLISAVPLNTPKTITLTIPASATAALTKRNAVIEVEMESPANIVDQLIPPTTVVIRDEVATN